MNYDIEEIKRSISIPEMLRHLSHECPDKDDCMIKSPLRDEKTASFHVFDQGRRGKDFGGDFSGDVIDLYMAITGDDSSTAIQAVAEMAGIAEQAQERLNAPRVNRRKRVAVSEHEMWTDGWKKFAKDAREKLICVSSNDLNSLMIKKGWNFDVIWNLARRGHLGLDCDGKPLYIYPHGIKRRGNPDNSRGDRWLWGKAKDNLWRGEKLADTSKTKLFLTEGETDLISLLRHRTEADHELSCSIPGASWTPKPVMAYQIGSHRHVYLMLDCDQAGFDATNRIVSAFKEHAINCTVHALSWKKILAELRPTNKKTDLGEVIGKLKKRIDDYFLIV